MVVVVVVVAVLVVEGSLEAKLRTQMEKHSQGEVQTWRKSEGRRSEREKVRREKRQLREKVGKSRNTAFPMFCGPGGSNSRLAKAAGAEPAGQMRDEKLHAVVARKNILK